MVKNMSGYISVFVLFLGVVVSVYSVDMSAAAPFDGVASDDSIQMHFRGTGWVSLDRRHPSTVFLLDYIAGLSEFRRRKDDMLPTSVSLAPAEYDLRILDRNGKQKCQGQILGGGGLLILDTAKFYMNAKYSREKMDALILALKSVKNVDGQPTNNSPAP
jgi:hypothetical protein